MIVYKYLHPERIDVLSNNLIRFTQPAALNDPFEVTPNLSEIRRFFEKLTKDLGQGTDLIDADDNFVSTQQTITDTFGRWNADNASKVTFLSLSKKRNNLLMWSHYCDSHRGFTLGFDACHRFFSIPIPGRKSVLREVSYADRPLMPAPDGDIDAFFRANTNILTKSHHWAYEEELRMCASPAAADETKAGLNEEPIYLFRFPSEALREVLLGYRMLKEHREAILQIVADRYPNAKIFQTALNESEYDLDVVPMPS
jgi:Protein of unknown function (DUF2971)